MRLALWARRHPLCGYFALTYAISWGGILMVMSATGFDLAALRPRETGLVFVCMLLGPSTSGLILTALLDGHMGLRKLWSSLTRWEVGMRCYAAALLTTPVLLLAVLWSLRAFVDPAFAPRFHWPLFAIGLIAGSFEEIGWTGFATPRLMARWPLPVAGLSLGLVWALWHLLVNFRQNSGAMAGTWLLEFAIFYGVSLTAYRMLMTWVYAHTRSLLLAVLMHASYTGWLFVLFPATSPDQNLLWQIAFAAGLCLAAAAILHRERQPT